MTRTGRRRRGSLTVVGTGITVAGQATLEAVAHIQHADLVFYLVTEPVTAAWVQTLNATATTLDDLYAEGKPRIRTYMEMAARIMRGVRRGKRVCAVFYGHPGVLVHAAHLVIAQARLGGYVARMLPGVSAEACLWADLGVNPGDFGAQSYEASDFLLHRRRFDPTTPLVLWQVGVLGEPSVRPAMVARPERLAVLARRLLRSYPVRHPVVIYEAAALPVEDPTVRRIRLEALSTSEIPAMATLFIPPRRQRRADQAVLAWFRQR